MAIDQYRSEVSIIDQRAVEAALHRGEIVDGVTDLGPIRPPVGAEIVVIKSNEPGQLRSQAYQHFVGGTTVDVEEAPGPHMVQQSVQDQRPRRGIDLCQQVRQVYGGDVVRKPVRTFPVGLLGSQHKRPQAPASKRARQDACDEIGATHLAEGHGNDTVPRTLRKAVHTGLEHQVCRVVPRRQVRGKACLNTAYQRLDRPGFGNQVLERAIAESAHCCQVGSCGRDGILGEDAAEWAAISVASSGDCPKRDRAHELSSLAQAMQQPV